MRVLVADDEAMIRLGLRAMLNDAGHEVVGMAVNGNTALRLAEAAQPDVIILDIKLPGTNGLEVARQVMAQWPTAIVMLTSYSERAYIRRANAAPVFAYLVKPIQEALLMPTLELARARFTAWQVLQQEVTDLQASLEARDLIAQAKFALMEREGLSEREAFLRIHFESRRRRAPMRKVAEQILRERKQ